MGDRETEKRVWELEQGALVAAHINAAHGADHEARNSDHEPADVILISPSGRFPNRDAQVVSIPLDFRARDDKHTVRNIVRTLTELLRHEGMCDALIGVIPSGRAQMHGVPRRLLEELARLIVRRGRDANAELHYEEIYENSEQLADYCTRSLFPIILKFTTSQKLRFQLGVLCLSMEDGLQRVFKRSCNVTAGNRRCVI